MPARKRLPKLPDYTGTPRYQDKMLVQKTNPLQTLSQTGMTLAEFKILDVYLARIDSHDEEKRYVRFAKGELEQLLGVDRIRKEDLDQRLKNLFQTVKIIDPEKPRGFTLIGLFEKAIAYQDEDGLWQVDLACTPSAMEYVFHPEALGYLRYRLRNVLELSSRYSYVLYLYLLDNRYRGSWEVTIDELKEILRCTGASYDSYTVLNKEILRRCHQEIMEKTDLRYSYEPIRKGRKTAKVCFTIETAAGAEQIPGQMDLQQLYPAAMTPEHLDPDEGRDETIALLADATCPRGSQTPEFTDAQVEELLEIIVTVPEGKLPHVPEVGDGIELRRYHYLAQRYAALNTAAQKTRIRDRFSYLRKMIQKEAISDE